jgi:tricorn protease
MDVGILRLPFRGWFTVNDGEDMEKHGAVPHHVLWPEPGALPQGRDTQLAKAIEVLRADVEAWHKRPQPKLRLSTER